VAYLKKMAAGIAAFLQFNSVKWAETAAWGHFGRGEFSWG